MPRWWIAGALVALAGCAAPDLAAQPAAITNGSADPGDPAVIGLANADAQVGCTATLIAPHTAITAAHCIAGGDPRTLRALIGGSVAGGVLLTISDGAVDPAFDPATLLHDLALVTIREDPAVAPLALEPVIDAALVGAEVRIVGFGTSAAGTTDGGTKLASTARVMAVDADELTAAPNPGQPCHGDSGGPLVLAAGTLGGVVSHGDAACSDHATYARIDTARAAFVDPYLAATAPGAVHTGDACLYDGECAEGQCLAALDDPQLFFCSETCSSDADCPAKLRCTEDRCRFPVPSPGALGAACLTDGDCREELCREGVCTRSCLGSADACPTGYECRGSGLEFECFATPAGCDGCATGGGAPAWLVIIALAGFARGRRSARSAAPRGSRAGRAPRAPGTRTGS